MCIKNWWWILIETDMNSDEISIVISPLVQDIQRILFDYFIPFIKKIEIS